VASSVSGCLFNQAVKRVDALSESWFITVTMTEESQHSSSSCGKWEFGLLLYILEPRDGLRLRMIDRAVLFITELTWFMYFKLMNLKKKKTFNNNNTRRETNGFASICLVLICSRTNPQKKLVTTTAADASCFGGGGGMEHFRSLHHYSLAKRL
jgi:hypothetical protein